MTPMCTNQHTTPKRNLTYSSLTLSLPTSNLAHPYQQALCRNTRHSTHPQPLRAPKHSQMLKLISCYYSLPFLSMQNRGLTRGKCEMNEIDNDSVALGESSGGVYRTICDFYPGPIVYCTLVTTPLKYVASCRPCTIYNIKVASS